jgi:hypothetical protein
MRHCLIALLAIHCIIITYPASLRGFLIHIAALKSSVFAHGLPDVQRDPFRALPSLASSASRRPCLAR